METFFQGRPEKLKGGGRILRRIYYFGEILNKMSEKGGEAKDRRPPPPTVQLLLESSDII